MVEPHESPAEGSNPSPAPEGGTPGAPTSPQPDAAAPGADGPDGWDVRAAESVLAAAREAAAKVAAALDLADAPGPAVDLRAAIQAFDASVDDPESRARVRRGGYHLAGLLEAIGVLPAAFTLSLADGVADFIAPPGGEG